VSTVPFHDIADELRAIADRVTTLGDQVHTGTYTVPEEPPPVEPPPETASSVETVEELPAE